MKAVFGVLVTLLVAAIAFIALIRFDVAGLGTQVIGPSLVDVPILNMILPEMPVEESEETETQSYDFETVEDAVEILKITEKMLKEKASEAEILSEQVQQLSAEVDRLKIFEGNQLLFEQEKAEFDALVADAATPIEFEQWFASMYPENAANIYADVVEEIAYDNELKTTIDIYQSMKPAQAAPVLEGMSITKLDQVATIIKGLSADQAADILGLMEPDSAAKITSYIYPIQ